MKSFLNIRVECDGYYVNHKHFTWIGSMICGWGQYIIAMVEWAISHL